MRTVLSEARQIAQDAHPALAGRVALRRPASGTSTDQGAHGVVTLPDAGPELHGDGQALRQGLRVQLSVWQTIGSEDPTVLDALVAAYGAARGWRWLGVTELVEQPGDLLQHVVSLGYSRPVPPS